MNANEYKIKYESIEEFRRMAYKNIACWEDQLSEIEGGLNRLLNMKSFQGETADAVRLYLQEVHKTLLSGIRQCLQEYKVRLLLYQKEYYKIDADKGACLSEKEICQIGNHLEKQEKYLYEKNEEIKKILIDIWDILLLPVPSQETLLSDITETIKTTRTLDTDIQCYETTIEKEVTQEYGSMVESTRAAVEKYIGRTRDISNYTPGETGKVKEMAALKEKITKSKLYLKEKQTEINIASEQLKDRAIRERLGWYQQQLEALKTVDVSQLVDNIAEYFGKSLEQVVMGNFTTDVTLLGTVSQVLLGLSGLDLPCDLRDIIADVKHCSEGEKGAAAMLVLDLVAVVPGIGAIKYADEAGTVVKGIGKNIGDIAGEVKNGEKLLKSTGEAKAVQEELEQAGKALKKVGKEEDAGKDAVKIGSTSNVFKAPEITTNSKGELTNGTYTLNQQDMLIHVDGKNPNKSQFLYDVDANKAVLDASAYADANNLWEASSGNLTDFANKAKVPITNGYVGVTGKGELTSYINVYRTKKGYIHGCPGNP